MTDYHDIALKAIMLEFRRVVVEAKNNKIKTNVPGSHIFLVIPHRIKPKQLILVTHNAETVSDWSMLF